VCVRERKRDRLRVVLVCVWVCGSISSHICIDDHR
jgi:hypothetical protein